MVFQRHFSPSPPTERWPVPPNPKSAVESFDRLRWRFFEPFRKLDTKRHPFVSLCTGKPAGGLEFASCPPLISLRTARAVIRTWIPGIRIIESRLCGERNADQQLREFSTSSHSYKMWLATRCNLLKTEVAPRHGFEPRRNEFFGISKLLILRSATSHESHGIDRIRTAFVQSN